MRNGFDDIDLTSSLSNLAVLEASSTKESEWEGKDNLGGQHKKFGNDGAEEIAQVIEKSVRIREDMFDCSLICSYGD